MTTLVGGVRGKPEGWLGNAAVGTIFGVEWRRVLDLEFKDTAPLGNNPMNEDKPVRIARCASWALGLLLLPGAPAVRISTAPAFHRWARAAFTLAMSGLVQVRAAGNNRAVQQSLTII